MTGLEGKVAGVRVTGPLAPLVGAFGGWLAAAGYSPLSAVTQLRLLADVSGWLEARALSARDLTGLRREEYLADRRAAGRSWLVGPNALASVLAFLAEQGALPADEPAAPLSPVEALLVQFEGYLRDERALASTTRGAYVCRARRFLTAYAPDGEVGALTVADVTGAVLAEGGDRSVGAVQFFAAALRAFLRFAAVTGMARSDLSAAALPVTGRRESLLPRGASPADVKALLGSCERREAVGQRDYAVLLLLVRLGLRAGEVAALRLDDVDWRDGLVLIRGKGHREDTLPLPCDVGEAVAAYLSRGRPPTRRREVFVSAVAPVRAMTRGSVSLVVRRACLRAGLEAFGAHRLRHTAACEMLAAQVPLAQVGQVLRHRGVVTTATYANSRELRQMGERPQVA